MTKGKGKHPHKALTAARVRALKEPGRYGDGGGLYLVVDTSGAKRWMLRTVVLGRRRDIGLGGFQNVSLAEAREAAGAVRKEARSGKDPLAERNKQRLQIPTFEDAAKTVHQTHSKSWKNKKHSDQWINTLTHYAFPEIGQRPISDLTTPDILSVLSPIWLSKPETARRVKQRMSVVFDWAKASGFFTGDNPVSGVSKGLPKQPTRQDHHAAMAADDLPQFLSDLRKSDGAVSTKLAFEFLILTATRTSEVQRAKWQEFDLKKAVWTIPASRMKAGRKHVVPLTRRCLELLAEARELNDGSDFVFPGNQTGKPLSNMAFLMVLRRMNLNVTAHGFRSTFRDWASETTNFPREVCEMALAHTIKDKTEAAYRRGDLLEKRRALMEAWALFARGQTSKVVELTASRNRK